MSIESSYMTATEQLAQMEALGFEAINNSIFAGRMPPEQEKIAGMYPAGMFIGWAPGDVVGKLAESLGPALKPLTPAFNSAAAKPSEPAVSLFFDPRAKINTGMTG